MKSPREHRPHTAEAVVTSGLVVCAAVLVGLIVARPDLDEVIARAEVANAGPARVLGGGAAAPTSARAGAKLSAARPAPRPAVSSSPASTGPDDLEDAEVDVDAAELVVEPGTSPARQARLRRDALDFEIVRRAARAEGVALDAAQRRALDRLWDDAISRDARVTDRMGLDPAIAERDLRAFETHMLLEAIAEARGLPSRHVDPESVRAYYAEHADELPRLPEGPERARAWRMVEIEIRRRLTPEAVTRHDRELAALLEELREASTVE